MAMYLYCLSLCKWLGHNVYVNQDNLFIFNLFVIYVLPTLVIIVQ